MLMDHPAPSQVVREPEAHAGQEGSRVRVRLPPTSGSTRSAAVRPLGHESQQCLGEIAADPGSDAQGSQKLVYVQRTDAHRILPVAPEGGAGSDAERRRRPFPPRDGYSRMLSTGRGEFPKEFEVCGVTVQELGRRADDGIEAIRAPVPGHVQGTLRPLRGRGDGARLLQVPHPSIWVGGR
jgi:hypothetical protein